MVQLQELVTWWEAVHYTALQRRCAEAGMLELAAKQATSLLRYIGAIPADKAFFQAGAVDDRMCRPSLDMWSTLGQVPFPVLMLIKHAMHHKPVCVISLQMHMDAAHPINSYCHF